MAAQPATELTEISCEQRFSRRSLGYLWSRRQEIDPYQVKLLQVLYLGRKSGSIEGIFPVKYKLKETRAGKLGFGRLYGTKGSLETLERECRGTMCREFYDDIDVVNCHPVILHQLAKRYGVELTEVKKYCDRRTEYLEKISPSKDIAKQAILMVLYNGKNEHPFLAPMVNEIQEFSNWHLVTDPQYKELVKAVATHVQEVKAKHGSCNEKKGNFDGSFLAQILQTEERKIMLAMRESFMSQGFNVDVLAYDGVMLRKGDIPLTDEHLRTAERAIFQATQYKVDLVNKPFEYYEIPADVDVPNEWKDKVRVETDMQAGQVIYDQIRDHLVYTKCGFFYKAGLTWTQDTDCMRAHLRAIVMKSNLYKPSMKDQPLPYAQNVNCAKNIVQTVMDLAVVNADDQWIHRFFTSSLGYVLFKNGYWDFKQGVFVPVDSEEFDDDICFTEIIPYDFEPAPNEAKMAEIKHRLFLEPFGSTVAEYYLLMLARGLAGDRVKRFLVGIGPSNTGKSMITGVLKAAIGGYFSGWNGGNLLYRQTSQDEAAQLRWLYLLRTKRIIVSSELKSTGAIDGNVVKRLSNGGEDELQGREHSKNESDFHLYLLPILFAQDLPKMKPVDDAITDRFRAIPYKMVYTNNPSNDLELKKDPTLPEQVQTNEFRQAFVHLLFEAYTRFQQGGRVEVEPEEIQIAVKAVIGPSATVIEAFKDAYEVTNNPEDYLLSSTIEQWLKDSSLGVTTTKFGMEMKRYAEVNKLTHVVSKQKKVNKRNVQVWIGIREFKDETEEVKEVKEAREGEETE
jgi:phage/plasmid-associated DNA primase